MGMPSVVCFCVSGYYLLGQISILTSMARLRR